MAGQLTGSPAWRGGRWTSRITIARGRRIAIRLATCGEGDEAKARDRAAALAQAADRMRRSGRVDEGTMRAFLERAAAVDGRQLELTLEAVRRICDGEADPPGSGAITVREFGEQWTSGRLHRRFPDHVKRKSSAADDRDRLRKYVYPIVGPVPLAEVTVEHAEAILNRLPRRLAPATRRHVAQVFARLMKLAAYPARHIAASPVPEGYLPKTGCRRALTFLYPDEDRQLLASTAVPLYSRVLYGFLAREGMRRGEAAGLTWADLDLERGAVALDHNKTRDPRAWALEPGVVRALRAWWLRWRPAPAHPVFRGPGGSTLPTKDRNASERLRRHLRAAGVDRAELFERSDVRQPIRMHDLRATFITISLACGKTETWVADRTGHTSSVMINRYRRASRRVSELGLGELEPLDQAIPELSGGAS